jgi:hypothetical protein
VSIAAVFVEAALDPLAWFAVIQFWLWLFMAAIMQPPDDGDRLKQDDGDDREYRRIM